MLSATNIKSIFPFIRAVLQEVRKVLLEVIRTFDIN